MKNILIITVLFLAGSIFASCAKEPGPGGNREIKGSVMLDGEKAAGAHVFIYYNATEPGETYSNSTVTNKDGEFKFEGLQKGQYFIDAKYTCMEGFKHEANEAVVVNLGSNKGDAIVIDLVLR